MARLGFVDRIDADGISGWAFDEATGASPPLIVKIGSRVIAEIVASEFRSDLSEAGLGDGRCGFWWKFPPLADVTLPEVVSVRFADDDTPLVNGEQLYLGGELPKSELFGTVLAFGIWSVERVTVESGRIVAEGWMVAPFADPRPGAILCNGRLPTACDRVGRPELAQRLQVAHDAVAGFRCVFDVPDGGDGLTFTFADARTLRPFSAHHAVGWARSEAPLPPVQRRVRVGGTDDPGTFELTGANAYAAIDRALRDYFGSGLADAGAVLDWGCGCGRVSRFLPAHRRGALTGADIDPDNVAWCRENYAGARFETISVYPPTGFADATFDAAFGISIFTHLDESNQFAWLAELRRIVKPGGAVLLSIHGETAWMLNDIVLDRYAEWRSRGFVVLGKNHDLDGSGADTSEYYNTFTSRRYVFERWSRWFTVLDVLPGAVNNFQDLVVLRRDG